jgi:hypothetical protein
MEFETRLRNFAFWAIPWVFLFLIGVLLAWGTAFPSRFHWMFDLSAFVASLGSIAWGGYCHLFCLGPSSQEGGKTTCSTLQSMDRQWVWCVALNYLVGVLGIMATLVLL